MDGILYAVGGVSITKSSNICLTTVEAYDPSTNTWSTKASMPTAREGLGVGVINGILYAVGGNGTSTYLTTVEAYNPSTNTWSTRASMPTGRDGLSVGIINGILYAVGGVSITKSSNICLTTVEAYDPSTNTWSKAPSLSTKRALLGVGVVNGVLYVVGGAINFGFRSINTVEAL